MLEGKYKTNLIRKIEKLFPGCMILKNDASYRQGIPDLIILFETQWAMLEVKPRRTAFHEPNQDYYVEVLDEMSFSAFIYPENEDEVLNDLQRAFQTRRPTRVSQR